MNPNLALLLCLIFVAFLLRYDHRISQSQSWATWLPTLWMLRCASRPVNMWFDYHAFSELGASVEAGNPMDRNVLTVLIVAGLIVLVRRKVNLSVVVRENKWLCILFLYMAISMLWSDYMFVSVKRFIKVAGALVMALVVLTESSPYKTTESIMRRTVFVTIPFSVLLIKYYPALGVDFGTWTGGVTWAGVTQGKNTLGVLCMISMLMLAWIWIDNKQSDRSSTRLEKIGVLLILALTLWLLRGPGGAYSATSLVNTIVGLATFFTLRRFSSATYLPVIASLVVIGTVVSIVVTRVVFDATLLEVIAPLVGRNPNLTGRTDAIWEPLSIIALKNPILGVGYGGFWITPIMLDAKRTFNQAHNGYLDIWIELGVVGILLFCMVVLEFFRKATVAFKYNTDRGSFLLAFLLISLIHNFTESSYLKTTALLWYLFILLMVVCSNTDRLKYLAKIKFTGFLWIKTVLTSNPSSRYRKM